MANIDAPFGLQAAKAEYGTAPKLEEFSVKASVEIFQGQPVCLNSTSEVVDYTQTLALAGNFIGSAANYVAAAATRRKIFVTVDKDQLYEMQNDGSTALVPGQLVQITNANGGTAATGISVAQIKDNTGTSTLGTNVTNLRVLRVVRESKNVKELTSGADRRWLVRIVSPVHPRGMAGQAGYSGL